MNATNTNRDLTSVETPPTQHIYSTPRAASGSKKLPQTIFMVLALLLAALLVTPASAQRYLPTDILPSAGDSFRADAMNNFGQVSGGYTTPGGLEQPVVWGNGAFTELPLLPGAISGTARGINNAGQLVGACYTLQPDGSYLHRACIWENGTVRELPTVSGASYSAAWAINDVGTIVGRVYAGTSFDAVIWKGSAVAKLVPPVAGAQTIAKAIDNSGRVAVVWSSGDIYDGWGNCARWTPDVPNGTTGTMINLNSFGQVTDINNAGVICGDGLRIWTDVTAFQLPNYNNRGYAYGINDAGQVVGDSEGEAYWFTPFVWDAQNGTRDLNTLLAASTPYAYPGSLGNGVAINNGGQILVGTVLGYYALLTPTSQPPALEPPVLNTWVHQGVIQLYWAGLDGDWSYRLKRSTVSGGPYTTIATVTDSSTGLPNYCSYQDTLAAPGIRYYYVASSVDGPDESANSAEVSAIVLAPPTAPSSLTATLPKRGDGVVLTWKQSISPEIQWNRIYRSANGGAYAQIAQITAGTSYLDNTVSRRVTYSYKVTAVNSIGQEGPASNVVSVRLK